MNRHVESSPAVFGGKGDQEGRVLVVQFRYEGEKLTSGDLVLTRGQALRLATRLVKQALLEAVGW
ncbi:hypothetical protein SEA_SAPO_57 [Gordonia phage Sapo]|nr:hypothetical protein SEA_SAPO_57 [Gordonia phage Sapo]